LAAASPARAERAPSYNDAQLKLLVSGSKVEATGKATCQSWPSVSDVTVKFDFKAEGTLTAVYNCTDNYVAEDDGTDT
jgi:hypothetical protein